MKKWLPRSLNPKRLKQGIDKLHQSIVEDARKEMGKPSGLPKNWRDRIIKTPA